MRVFFWLAIGFGAGLAVGVFLGRAYLIPAPSEPPQDLLRENVYPRAEQTVPDVSRPDGLGMLRAEVPQPAAPTPDPPGGDERAEDRQARVRRWQELSPQAML